LAHRPGQLTPSQPPWRRQNWPWRPAPAAKRAAPARVSVDRESLP
jgi:hypothetical protein